MKKKIYKLKLLKLYSAPPTMAVIRTLVFEYNLTTREAYLFMKAKTFKEAIEILQYYTKAEITEEEVA
jgi:hypothetical protein